MSVEAVVEVAVYMHKFHNLDLFQQGWYQIKVTSRWEGSEDAPGVPSRVVQYEAPDIGSDDSAAIWQINDADHSFSTHPFRIKYARQDVFLAVMVSFNLSLRAVERLLANAALIRFELLYAPTSGILSLNMSSSELSSCANHDFRVPPKALLGLHAYCPLHFDTWHMVLVDLTLHSSLLKVNSTSSVLQIRSSEHGQLENGNAESQAEDNEANGADNLEVDAKDIALWKALCASRDILKHELEALGIAIQQRVDFEMVEHSVVISVAKKLKLGSSEENETASPNENGDLNSPPKEKSWSKDIADSLKSSNLSVDSRKESSQPVVLRTELLEAFQSLGSELSSLWNTFLKFHRANRLLLWEYLRGVWAEDRSTEWSMWLVHSKMDISNGLPGSEGQDSSKDVHFLKKGLSRKVHEEPAVISASRAELHRKTLEQMKMNGRSLQDMQIFGNPSQLPVIYVERHIVHCEKPVPEATLPNGPRGLMETAHGLAFLEKPANLFKRTSKGHGKVLRVVVFVHGFQGHHLDLRLVRNHWLLIDPGVEWLMSEINEDRTMSDFKELGQRLAEEVAAFLKSKFSTFLKKAPHGNCRLSFVGHSIGNLIIRTALTDAALNPYLQYLYTFLSISGPHLGYLYSSNTLFNSGLWLLKKLKASPCMHQLTFTDHNDLQNSFVFKLSQDKTLEYFQNVLLLSSPQDRYVPYHSARIEMCQTAMRDSKRGPVYARMVRSCLDQILKPSAQVDRNFVRCDVNFDTSTQARTLNNFIGRTAHIEFLETDAFLRFIMWTFPKFFS